MLEDAVGIVLEANPNIRAALSGIAAANELAGEARASYYPTADFVAGYDRWERRESGRKLSGTTRSPDRRLCAQPEH